MSATLKCFVIGMLLCSSLAVARAQDAPADVTLPASGDEAAAALAESPRHGEWVDVPVPGEQADVQTWVVYPERADGAPVVLVVHEIYGLTDWVRAVADRLAAEGFIAVAPDLLSGKGPDGGGTEAFDEDEVRRAIRDLSEEEVVRRLNAVRDFALALPAAADTSAVIGFCWGGSTSFTYATQQPALDAAVVYYGTAPDDREALARIDAPVLGLYGGDDARVTSTVEPTAEAMKTLGKPYTYHVYEGAGHGFLRQQAGRDEANRQAAKQAWRTTLEFLREQLETP